MIYKIYITDTIKKEESLYKAISIASKEDNAYVLNDKERIVYKQDGKIYKNINNDGVDINSQTKKYIKLPINYYPNSTKANDLEYHSGAYNYMFSKNGHQKLKTKILLSKAIYEETKDGTKWNAYILFNHKSVDQLDLGLIANVINNEVVLRPCLYYMGGKYPKEFKVYDDIIVTKMAKKDDNTYGNADDLEIEFTKTKNGWEICFLNLTTKQQHKIKAEYDNIHEGVNEDRFLIGVSYCPINSVLWNPENGGSFKNIIFENTRINNGVNEFEFYPGSKTMKIGYTQGSNWAYYETNGKKFIMGTNYESTKTFRYNKKNIIGRKFGFLTVISATKERTPKKSIYYECRCECGQTRYVIVDNLRRGNITRCKECAKKVDNLGDYSRNKVSSALNVEGTNLTIIANKRQNSNNTSKHKGVVYDKTRKKWRAQIVFKKKCYNLGRFNDIRDAIDARKKAEEELFHPIVEKYSTQEIIVNGIDYSKYAKDVYEKNFKK